MSTCGEILGTPASLASIALCSTSQCASVASKNDVWVRVRVIIDHASTESSRPESPRDYKAQTTTNDECIWVFLQILRQGGNLLYSLIIVYPVTFC